MRPWAVAAVVLLLARTAPAVELPVVSIEAIPQHPVSVEPLEALLRTPTPEALPIALSVANASDRELRDLQLVLVSGDFELASPQPRLPDLPAFGTFLGRIAIRGRSDAPPYGRHDVVLAVRYRWEDGDRQYTSAQIAKLAIEVNRPFEAEAKGLPGGTAALFHLLLPVFPAFFAYQFVDRLRRGQGIRVPVFGSEYVLPSFFIGLLVHSLLLHGSRAEVLAAAAVVGALWPTIRWIWETLLRWLWELRDDDAPRVYLRKALLSPYGPRRSLMVTGKAGSETWSGVLLAQPDGRPALGSRYQVSASDPARAEEAKDLVEAINTGARWARWNRWRLVWGVRSKSLALQPLQYVKRGEESHPGIVATDELVGFELQRAAKTEIVVFTF